MSLDAFFILALIGGLWLLWSLVRDNRKGR